MKTFTKEFYHLIICLSFLFVIFSGSRNPWRKSNFENVDIKDNNETTIGDRPLLILHLGPYKTGKQFIVSSSYPTS